MARDREASAVLLLRGTGTDLEVFLVDRAPELRFFGGYAAFPGGTRGPEDESAGATRDAVLRRCAARELFEETGVLLGTDAAAPDQRRSMRKALLADDPAPWQAFVGREPVAALLDLCRIRTPPF